MARKRQGSNGLWIVHLHSVAREQRGFSLALALLVVLAGLFTTLAITSRTIGSRQVRDSDDKSFSARNAAEIGMTRIVSELNRPRNRRLLVNAPGLGATGATTTTIGTNEDFRSACDLAGGEGPDLSGQGTFDSGAVLNNEVTIPNTNNRLHYKLVRIVNGDPAVGSFPDPNLSEQDADGNANTAFADTVTLGNGATPVTEGKSGRITLDVTGRAVDAGGKESLYHLRKTFAVIPKCCGSSFGGFRSSGDADLWGSDERTNCGVASGYGLILGSRRDLTNDDTKGSLSTLLAVLLERTIDGSTTSSTVNRVYCTVPRSNPVATDCPLDSSASIVRTNLRLKDITLPPLPFPSNINNLNTGNYLFTANQPTLSEFTATRPSGSTTPLPRWFWDTAPTGSCTSGTCQVPGYSRMRVCDAAVSNGTTTPPWLGGSHRSISNATLSSSAPVPGCNITISSDETLNTRDFANWRTSAGNTLKWHLGRLCRSITWPPTDGVTTIYCSLDQLTLNGADITFDTAGNSANTSIPIILSFPNGNSTLRPITNAQRSSNRVTLTICTTSACGGAHSFAVGQTIVVGDLPSPFTAINNTPTSQSYTIDQVTSTTIRFPQNGSNISSAAVLAGYAANRNPPISASQTIVNSTFRYCGLSCFFTPSSIRQINTQRSGDPRLTDLSIYGCPTGQFTPCRFQRISSGFGASLTLRDVFIYAPYSTMSASISFLSYRGAFWGNKLSQTISGSSFTIPAGSIDAVVNSFPGWTPAALDLEQDYVARQVIRVGTFNPN